MMEIDFKHPLIWDQVKDAKMSDLEGLDYYVRYHLMNRLGQEYSANMMPDNPGAFRRLLGQEDMLRNLFFIDSMEPVQYKDDEEALQRFNQSVIDSGKFEDWKTRWGSRDYLKQRGVFFQVARQFGEAFGVDLQPRYFKQQPTHIVNATVDASTGDVLFNNDRELDRDFLRAYHGMIYACARLYQEQLVSGKIPFERGGDREDLAFRTFGDLSPEESMFWESNGFNNFMNQPTRRHASWIADNALDSLAAAYDPERREDLPRIIRDDMNSRYMSAKVLYSANMPIHAPEDVWNALSPIFGHHIRGLSIEAQKEVVRLANDIHQKGQPVPKELNDSIDRILDSYPLTDAYKRFQVQKQAKLLTRMAQDERILDAKKNWNQYSQYQKIGLLQHAVDMHAEVFGCRKCRVEAVDIPPRFDPETKRNIITYGQYLWRKPTRVIHVNVNDDAHVLDNFAEALNTSLHEAQHGFQDHVAREYEWNSIEADSPLFEQARYFSVGSHVYVNPEQNRDHYHNNPLERDAFAVGNGLSYFIALANNQQREEYARRMELLMQDPEKHDLDLSRGLPGAPWSHQMPEPEA